MSTGQNGKIWTYVATDLSHTYKIGQSSNVYSRIKELAVGNPNIKLLFIIRANVESQLHEIFRDKNYFGEWFSLSNDDIKRIKLQFAKYIVTPEEDEIGKKHKLRMYDWYFHEVTAPFSVKRKIDKNTIDYYFSYVVQHRSSNCFIFVITKNISNVLDAKGNIRGGVLLGYARGIWFNNISLYTQHWGSYTQYKEFVRNSKSLYRKIRDEK